MPHPPLYPDPSLARIRRIAKERKHHNRKLREIARRTGSYGVATKERAI